MSGSKIVMVMLVVVTVLFAGVLFVGPRNDAAATSDTFSAKDYPALGSLNTVLAPFAPKVSAKSIAPLVQTFDLAATPEYKLNILPDASKNFRQLAFTATPSKACARVTYTPSKTGGINQVETSAKAGSSDHPERFAFVLSADGGVLDVRRASTTTENSLCVLTLQTAQ